MSFLSNLGKEFVRSAVRQVGRDGGKIISNHLYGNAHSTPIRNVENEQMLSEAIHSKKTLSLSEREIAIQENYTVDNELKMGIGMKIFYTIVGTCFSFASYKVHVIYLFVMLLAFLLFIIGVRRLFRRTITLSRTDLEDAYKQDLRFSTGRRYLGKQAVKHTIKVMANKEERNNLIIRGLVYISISFLWLALPILLVMVKNS